MRTPLPPPPLLGEAARPRASRSVPGDQWDVHTFDLKTQRAPALPAFTGVRVFENLIDADEARTLLDEIEQCAFIPSQSGRLKQHFGARVNFNKRRMNVRAFQGLPGYANRLLDRFTARLTADSAGCRELVEAHADFLLTDVFVLRYRERQRANLDLHLDDTYAYGDLILDLSLESGSAMTFYRGRPDGEVPAKPGERIEPACVRVPLPPRSIVAIHGSARFEWEHGILADDVHGQRTSITFRTLSPELRETADGRWLLEACRPSTNQRKAPRACTS